MLKKHFKFWTVSSILLATTPLIVACSVAQNTSSVFSSTSNKLSLNQSNPYYSIYQSQFAMNQFMSNQFDKLIEISFAKVPFQIQNADSKIININDDFAKEHINELYQIGENNKEIHLTSEHSKIELDQPKVTIKNFKQNKLANRFIKLSIDKTKMLEKAKILGLDINNFYYQIIYSQIHENNDDSKILDVPIEIRYYNPDKSSNPYSRETLITITKQIKGFAPNLQRQANIDATKFLTSIDYKNKDKTSIYQAYENLVSKETEGSGEQSIERTKYLDHLISQINLLSATVPANSSSKYYLSDVKISNDLNTLILTIATVTGDKDNTAYSTKKEYKIQGFAASNQQEIEQIIKNNFVASLKGGLSFYNYDWAHAQIFDFQTNFDDNNDIQTTITSLKGNQAQKSANASVHVKSKSNKFAEFDFSTRIGVPKFVELFSPSDKLSASQIDSPWNAALYVPELQRRNIGEIQNNINISANSPVTSGGYKEFRTFYTSNKWSSAVHYGEDVLVPAGTSLKTFAKSKILGAYYLPSQGLAEGIGTIVALQTDVKDLNIDQKIKDKYLRNIDAIVFFFIHLDNNNLKLLGKVEQTNVGKRNATVVSDIDPLHPKLEDKNFNFATIGETSNNGGWNPHVHIEAYPVRYEIKDGKKVWAKNFLNSKYILSDNNRLRIAPKRIDRYKTETNGKITWALTVLKEAGVQVTNSRPIYLVNTDGSKTSNEDPDFKGYKNRDYTDSIDDLFIKNQALDPNWFFQFKDNKSSKVRLDNLYIKAKQNA